MPKKKIDPKSEYVQKVVKGDANDYVISWNEEGVPYKFKKKTEIKKGKTSRAKGQLFETKVREDLEKMGWIVSKWMNTIDFEKGAVAPAKRKYNPFNKALTIGTGFPDFICFKQKEDLYEVLAVEVKTNGLLDKKEIGQCLWLLENKIFPKILIAKKIKIKNRVSVEYINVKEKYGKRL